MSESIEAIRGSGAIKKVMENHDGIKPETKEKLKALGIDASQIKTETEAQKRIKEAEAAQANATTQNIGPSHEMERVIKDSVKLADKLGIKVRNMENMDELFHVMDKTIRGFEKQVVDDVDNERRDMINDVRTLYKKLHNKYLHEVKQMDKISENLNLLSLYNIVRS